LLIVATNYPDLNSHRKCPPLLQSSPASFNSSSLGSETSVRGSNRIFFRFAVPFFNPCFLSPLVYALTQHRVGFILVAPLVTRDGYPLGCWNRWSGRNRPVPTGPVAFGEKPLLLHPTPTPAPLGRGGEGFTHFCLCPLVKTQRGGEVDQGGLKVKIQRAQEGYPYLI